MSENDFEYQSRQPEAPLSNFVDYFWMVANRSELDKQVIVLPNGRIDVLFTFSQSDAFKAILLGLETEATETIFSSNMVVFGVSLKLLSIEYLLKFSIADLLDSVKQLPAGFWGIERQDLNDFESFCVKVSYQINLLISAQVDERKQNLFNLIYKSNGSMSVAALSEEVIWSSRQINRYFSQQFGVSLKAYCNILRFVASFPQLKMGKLFPEQNFADQAHFIKEVKRLSGVTPKEFSKDKKDRFVQFLSLVKK
jgi:AraC-like DNA-binding protein